MKKISIFVVIFYLMLFLSFPAGAAPIAIGNQNAGKLYISNAVMGATSTYIAGWGEVSYSSSARDILLVPGEMVSLVQQEGVRGGNHIVIGDRTAMTADQGIAIGYGSRGTIDSSVAIGSNAKTIEGNATSTLGADTYNQNINVVGKEYINNYAGQEATGVFSVGDTRQERRVQNVAAGLVGENSTDAVNGSQLYQAYIDLKPTDVIAGTGILVEKTEDGAVVSLDEDRLESLRVKKEVNIGETKVDGEGVSVEGGPIITKATIDMADNRVQNMSDGVYQNDAVTLRQLDSLSADLNQKIEGLRSDIRHLRKRSDAGTAAAMAMAGLPQAYIPGKSMVAMSGGTFQGQNAMAIGISTISKDGAWVFKLQGSTTAQNQQGFSVGVGYQF